MKKQTKAKKATAGEREVMRQCHISLRTLRADPGFVNYASVADDAISHERERCVEIAQRRSGYFYNISFKEQFIDAIREANP